LHSDLNSFYASVECFRNPKIRQQPVAVCGDPQSRHGIVLTKNLIAKKYGVSTGQAIWQAKQLCPKLIVVNPNYDLYLKYSRLTREIYYDYTNQIEAFGIDEAWLDCTGSTQLHGSGEEIAHKIRKRIFKELGVTVSIGVSFCKVFAKLGSDYKKPDAVTVFSRENYKEKVWSLPVSELLYVGKATNREMLKYNIKTIGDLANADPKYLYLNFGKVGIMLSRFANGIDHSPVCTNDVRHIEKSIGNSQTMVRDLVNDEDVWVTFLMLSESVASRLRDNCLRCQTIQISLRDKNMFSCERQGKTQSPTCLSTEIASKAMEIFKTKYQMRDPLRSVGVRASDLISMDMNVQMSMFHDFEKQDRQEKLEFAIDELRERFGYDCIQKGILMVDKDLTGHNVKEHNIHPPSLFTDKMPV